MKKLVILFGLLFAALLAPSAGAQAVCNSATNPADSVCGPNNSLSWTLPTTNTSGTPFNDYASTRVVFGPAATLCSAQGVPVVGTTVRNMGAMGVPPSPLPNFTASTLLGALSMPNGMTFATLQVVNVVGTVSACPSPVQFTFQGSTPAAPAGVKVGP